MHDALDEALIIPGAPDAWPPSSDTSGAKSESDVDAPERTLKEAAKVSAEGVEEELPVWEIELPQDILPQEYFPDPQRKDAGSVKRHGTEVPGLAEAPGEIDYDFNDVDVVFPEFEEAAESDASRVTPKSPETADAVDMPQSPKKTPLPGDEEGR